MRIEKLHQCSSCQYSYAIDESNDQMQIIHYICEYNGESPFTIFTRDQNWSYYSANFNFKFNPPKECFDPLYFLVRFPDPLTADNDETYQKAIRTLMKIGSVKTSIHSYKKRE